MSHLFIPGLHIVENLSLSQSCSKLRKESKRFLDSSRGLTRERQEVSRGLQSQLSSLQRTERQLEDRRQAMAKERKRLMETRQSILCSKCQKEAAVDQAIMRSSGDGQYSMVGRVGL